jgi:hypothetical protein
VSLTTILDLKIKTQMMNFTEQSVVVQEARITSQEQTLQRIDSTTREEGPLSIGNASLGAIVTMEQMLLQLLDIEISLMCT